MGLASGVIKAQAMKKKSENIVEKSTKGRLPKRSENCLLIKLAAITDTPSTTE